MKVSEYLKQDKTNGFMPVFENAYPETYQKIFGTTDPLLLDTNIALLYGGREMIDTFSQDTAVYLIKGVILLKADSWTKQADLLNIDYSVLSPVTAKTETTISENTNETGTGTDTKQSTTFNDSTFGDDEKTEQSTTGTKQAEKTQTTTQTGIGSKSPVDLIKEEISLRRTSLKAQVINEIVNELILSVY